MKKITKYLNIFILLLVISACSDSGTTAVKEKEGETKVTLEKIASIDQRVTDLMSAYNIPGASLAISKDGKMVYEMAYGFADETTGTELTTDHVFRIASCSKTFTGAAIMQLIQNGELAISDKVFGPDGIFGTRYGSKAYSNRVLDITVEDLLHHTFGGWGVNSGGDPIDYEPQMNDADFIGYVLDNWPLQYDNDTQFVYSNMGYYLLARIIEEVSGQSYADYLRDDLLAGESIESLHVTNFDQNDRQSNEVEYFGQGVEQQYVYTIADRRDGDAGVVISAEDLLKFINAIDGDASRPDILNQETLQLFTTPSPINSYAAGIGIWEKQNLWYHYGSLPGMRSAFMRHDNGLNIVLLFNSRPTQAHQQFVFDMQDALVNILNDSQISYQNIDLFVE